MTLNARFILKCALQTARLTYVRCGFRIRPYAQHRYSQKRAEGEWAGGPSPPLPNSLHPCGQLTRCFSAVAELLVYFWNTAATLANFYFWEISHVLQDLLNSSSNTSEIPLITQLALTNWFDQFPATYLFLTCLKWSWPHQLWWYFLIISTLKSSVYLV